MLAGIHPGPLGEQIAVVHDPQARGMQQLATIAAKNFAGLEYRVHKASRLVDVMNAVDSLADHYRNGPSDPRTEQLAVRFFGQGDLTNKEGRWESTLSGTWSDSYQSSTPGEKDKEALLATHFNVEIVAAAVKRLSESIVGFDIANLYLARNSVDLAPLTRRLLDL